MRGARSQDRPGFTLAELAVSVAVTGLLFVGLGSAILLSAWALPDEQHPLTRLVQQARALDRLASELEAARYVLERTERALTFTMADRDGDGVPERIRYAWSGTAGDPLTRVYPRMPRPAAPRRSWPLRTTSARPGPG